MTSFGAFVAPGAGLLGTGMAEDSPRASHLRWGGRFLLVIDPPHSDGLGLPRGYAILVPRERSTMRTAKLVPIELARVLHAWSLLPELRFDAAALTQLGNDPLGVITSLVFDGIVDIMVGDDWVTGPASVAHCGSPLRHDSGGPSGISLAIVRARLAAPHQAPRQVARDLYIDGFWPASAERLRRMESGAALGVWYGLTGSDASLGGGHWRNPDLTMQAPWWVWQRQLAQQKAPTLSWKLYLSPAPEWVPHLLALALPILADFGAVAFKVPGNPRDIFRSDKFVAYFDDRAAMIAAGMAIDEVAGDTPIQPTPFTCALTGSGRVSWGVDPPRSVRLPWADDHSWRWWACSRLAAAIATVRESGLQGDRAMDALWMRVAACGLDVSTWAPTDDLLHEWSVEQHTNG